MGGARFFGGIGCVLLLTLATLLRSIEAELDRVGAAIEALTVETVDEITRTGTGAKEKLVRASG